MACLSLCSRAEYEVADNKWNGAEIVGISVGYFTAITFFVLGILASTNVIQCSLGSTMALYSAATIVFLFTALQDQGIRIHKTLATYHGM